MEVETNHCACLQKFCRLCGKHIQLKYGYKTAKTVQEFSNIIYSVYGIDVEVEDFNVFPRSLCGNCVRRIKRMNQENATVHLTAATFLPHNDLCIICFDKPGNITDLHIKDLDVDLLRYGFFKSCAEGSLLYLHDYI